MQTDPVAWYDQHAARQADIYEALPPILHRPWLADLLPKPPGVVIDIGAGSGRDADAFAQAGFEILAVEPSAGMRAEAERRHSSPRIRWLSDRLPALTATLQAAVAADVVCLNAVWHHVFPAERPRAFRKLVGLLRPAGVLIMTLRHGPDDGRVSYSVSLAEVEVLARDHGLEVLRTETSPDAQARAGVSWTAVIMRLPDDGTGALPLLRHLILNDAKSATYKLGLLRALCRAADSSAGLAEDAGEAHVRLPLGLVALNWSRLYLPLVRADLPQAPGNSRRAEGLGFAGPGLQALMNGAAAPADLRVGTVFGSGSAAAVHSALRAAADHICRMPAHYLTFPAGGQIFVTTKMRASRPDGAMILDRSALAAFGWMQVPRNLWTAMQRYAAWIEPALIAEWERLMHAYAGTQGRSLDPGIVAAGMTWLDPERDVGVPRSRALSLMRAAPLYCVWTGRRLTPENLDIDHCFPWSAWPCGDLWNLMPASRQVNQSQKRERLPSADALRRARDPISSWWSSAYFHEADKVLPERFVTEARASLPGLQAGDVVSIDEVFEGMMLQRIRVRSNQGVPEWEPKGSVG